MPSNYDPFQFGVTGRVYYHLSENCLVSPTKPSSGTCKSHQNDEAAATKNPKFRRASDASGGDAAGWQPSLAHTHTPLLRVMNNSNERMMAFRSIQMPTSPTSRLLSTLSYQMSN